MHPTLTASLQVLYRSLYSKMVASLVSYFGLANLALAEDIVQDTFVAALESWTTAMPDNPQAWLFRVCRNKTLNILREKKALPHGALDFPNEPQADYRLEQLFLDHEIHDNQLRLLFACCHPELSPKAQVIVILKNLCGLRVEEIARGLLMTDEAVMKSLTRSRHTLQQSGTPLNVPFILRSHARLHSVHLAIYLLFNEGYSATRGDTIIRYELLIEAMRLMRTILDIPEICTSDSYALMALMCLHASGLSLRIGTEGSLVELEQQDRSQREQDLVILGLQYLKQARGVTTPTRFILEASIASVHATASTFEAINWNTVIGLYRQLLSLHASPTVELALAVALFYGQGPQLAQEALDRSPHLAWLKASTHYHALLGKIHQAQQQTDAAREAYKKALSLTKLRAEQDFLTRKIESL